MPAVTAADLCALPEPATGWPRWVFEAPYDAARHPAAAPGGGALTPEGGANCQLYAYGVLGLLGRSVPPHRSSDLWEDPALWGWEEFAARALLGRRRACPGAGGSVGPGVSDRAPTGPGSRPRRRTRHNAVMDSDLSLPADYEISADPDRLDPERVHHLVSEHTFWAAGRERAAQDAILRTSRNYGVYERSTGLQVAYGRVVTDEVTFAWLADVIVDPGHRGRGIGRALIDAVLEDLAPLGLRRIVLKASEEGRPLYERAGWTGLQDPELWMERREG